MSTLEETARGIQQQAKEEQQQLKEANLALNRALKRENLLKTPGLDGREGARIKQKIQELEGELQENDRELPSERARMKAKLCHEQAHTERGRDFSHDWVANPQTR